MPPRFYQFTISVANGGLPFPRAIVGVPDDQMLELKKQFPDREFTGEDPQIQFAIRDGITDSEREKILSALSLLPGTTITFQIQPVPTTDIPPPDPPMFEGDGKLFWVRR
jgi:hypothetical protein